MIRASPPPDAFVVRHVSCHRCLGGGTVDRSRRTAAPRKPGSRLRPKPANARRVSAISPQASPWYCATSGGKKAGARKPARNPPEGRRSRGRRRSIHVRVRPPARRQGNRVSRPRPQDGVGRAVALSSRPETGQAHQLLESVRLLHGQRILLRGHGAPPRSRNTPTGSCATSRAAIWNAPFPSAFRSAGIRGTPVNWSGSTGMSFAPCRSNTSTAGGASQDDGRGGLREISRSLLAGQQVDDDEPSHGKEHRAALVGLRIRDRPRRRRLHQDGAEAATVASGEEPLFLLNRPAAGDEIPAFRKRRKPRGRRYAGSSMSSLATDLSRPDGRGFACPTIGSIALEFNILRYRGGPRVDPAWRRDGPAAAERDQSTSGGPFRGRPTRLDIDTGGADSAGRATGAPCPVEQREKKS